MFMNLGESLKEFLIDFRSQINNKKDAYKLRL